jgi:ABC-type sugar transport system ATPase subunit
MIASGGEPIATGGGSGASDPARLDPIAAMHGIHKSFGPVEVLHGVDFEVLPGEVHVLAGENGAGKSTLIKILSGVYDDFSGELNVGGQPQRFAHPKEAVQAGIATIHQELSLVPSMSVSDNLFLGREVAQRFGIVDFPLQESEAAHILEELELDLSPRTLVEELPISSQQLLEIARALGRDASVLILDEPTSALNEHEVGFLFERILELRRRGRGIVYITHRIEEIYRLADRITVLRDGGLVGTSSADELPPKKLFVGTSSADELPPKKLLNWMVGRDLHVESAGSTGTAPTAPTVPTAPSAAAAPSAPPALQVNDLRIAHAEIRGRFVVDGVSLTLRRGEILGLAGLQGSGTSEVLHALFGALGGRVTGRVRLGGEPFPIRGPRESVQRGLVLLTNDRKASGLAPDLQVTHNASLASLSRFCNHAGWVRREDEKRRCKT